MKKLKDRNDKSNKNRKRDILARKKVRENLDRIFYEINPSGEMLVPTNFNKVAEKGTFSYKFHFKKEWNIILKRYGKYDEFNKYIENEFIKWHNRTGQMSVKAFVIEELNCTVPFLKNINQDKLRALIGSKKQRNSDEDYKNEFDRVLDFYGRIPTQKEFLKESLFHTNEFKRRFKLTAPLYESVLKMYGISNEIIAQVYEEGNISKNQNLREANLGKFRNTKDEMIEEFHRVMNFYLAKYDRVPSSDEFKKDSKISPSTYKVHFNKTYHELAEHLGYEMDLTGSIFEKAVLDRITELLKEEPVYQATFEWLKSDLDVNLRCDGHFIQNNLIVEADGVQHDKPIDHFGGEESFVRTQANDAIKNTLIPQYGIKLLRIRYDDPYLDIDYLKFKLLSIGINIPNYKTISEK